MGGAGARAAWLALMLMPALPPDVRAHRPWIDDGPLKARFAGEKIEKANEQLLAKLAAGHLLTPDEISELESQLGTIRQTLAGLKKQLYARFGGNINLEEN